MSPWLFSFSLLSSLTPPPIPPPPPPHTAWSEGRTPGVSGRKPLLNRRHPERARALGDDHSRWERDAYHLHWRGGPRSVSDILVGRGHISVPNSSPGKQMTNVGNRGRHGAVKGLLQGVWANAGLCGWVGAGSSRPPQPAASGSNFCQVCAW